MVDPWLPLFGACKSRHTLMLRESLCPLQLFGYTLMPYHAFACLKLFCDHFPDALEVFAVAQLSEKGRVKPALASAAIQMQKQRAVGSAFGRRHHIEIAVCKKCLALKLYVFDLHCGYCPAQSCLRSGGRLPSVPQPLSPARPA